MQNIIDDTVTETAASGSAQTPPPPDAPDAAAAPVRPKGLPDKFWDTEKGEVRIDALWRSYRELEKRFGRGDRDVPERPEDYCLDCGERHPDPEVNAILHRAGFSNDQAQLVYDLAAHYVLPELQRAETRAGAENVRGRLEEHFGGKQRWNRIARQLGDWGKAHLPDDVMQALGGSFEGVLALHRMMASDEPGVATDAGATGDETDENKLKAMMQDPRYWRDQDPALIAKVRRGFQRLYPG